jgi:hypothetical protein
MGMKTQLALLFLAAGDLMLPCLSKQVFGIECPGCGIQRSIVFLMEGEFVAAFKMYPAIYPITLLFGFLAVDHFVRFKWSNSISIFLMVTSVLMILINYILKLL